MDKKEITIYHKRSFGSKSKKYRDTLDDAFEHGFISVFTYNRLINQYYSECL